MARTRSLRSMLAVALAATALAGCNLDTMLASPPAPDPAVPAGAPFGEIKDGQYVVAPGDTVAIVSERTNTPIRTLIDLNGLNPPYALKAGQMLNLQPRNNYLVQKGDTVSGIAARQGVSISALIQLNNLRPPYTLADRPSPGPADQRRCAGSRQRAARCAARRPAAQAVRAGRRNSRADSSRRNRFAATGRRHHRWRPAAAAGHACAIVRAGAGPAGRDRADPANSAAPTQTAQIEPPAPPKPAPAGDPLPALKPDSPFIWPVDGKVVSKFGPAKDNQRNDGINIAAPVGAPVKASAPGVVAYAGNELRGFGNMVLLRHADGWVTAYAHNSSLLVQKGDKVGQGQTIARVGSSGNVDTPQLHFELRKGTKAVDPLKVLTR